MPRTVTNVGHQPLGYWRRIPTTVECNRVANEAETVVNPEVEQLLSILDLNDQPPSIYNNVTLRKPREKRIELHQPRPMRQLAIRSALAHFEEVVNHTNEKQRPVATQPSVDAAPKPKPFNPRNIRPPPLFNGNALPLRGRVPATRLHQMAGPSSFKPPRSSPFKTTRVRPPAPRAASPIPIPQIRGCRIPSPDLPIHLHHHHGELPPSRFKLCRALIESSEEAAEWWGAFEAEPEPEEEEEDEDEESLNRGRVDYARRGSFRYSPDASEDEDGWARAARLERTADIDDLDVSVNPVRQWHAEAHLADDELLEAETDSEWFFTPPTSPDPYFPHARPVSPGLLESGMATVRLVPRSTTSAELDPPLPLQGQGAILGRMGSMNIGSST